MFSTRQRAGHSVRSAATKHVPVPVSMVCRMVQKFRHDSVMPTVRADALSSGLSGDVPRARPARPAAGWPAISPCRARFDGGAARGPETTGHGQRFCTFGLAKHSRPAPDGAARQCSPGRSTTLAAGDISVASFPRRQHGGVDVPCALSASGARPGVAVARQCAVGHKCRQFRDMAPVGVVDRE